MENQEGLRPQNTMSEDGRDKTSLQRWLDINPPTNDPRYNKIRSRCKKWGKFLRWKYPTNFDELYNDFWIKHPERWHEAYQDNESDLFP